MLAFLFFYILSGFGADLAQIMSDPNSLIPMVGASGAIAGVMGAYLLLYPNAKVDVALILVIIFKVFTLPAYVVLAIWMGLQIFGQLGGTTGGGVAYWAHIGGFIAGLILALPIWLRLGGTGFWQSSHYHPPHKPTFDTNTTNVPIIRRSR